MKKSSLASDYEERIKNLLKRGKIYGFAGAALAIFLTAINMHHYMGLAVLVTLFPMVIVYIEAQHLNKNAVTSRNKLTRIAKKASSILKEEKKTRETLFLIRKAAKQPLEEKQDDTSQLNEEISDKAKPVFSREKGEHTISMCLLLVSAISALYAAHCSRSIKISQYQNQHS